MSKSKTDLRNELEKEQHKGELLQLNLTEAQKALGSSITEGKALRNDLRAMTEERDRLEKEKEAIVNELSERDAALEAKEAELQATRQKLSETEEMLANSRKENEELERKRLDGERIVKDRDEQVVRLLSQVALLQSKISKQSSQQATTTTQQNRPPGAPPGPTATPAVPSSSSATAPADEVTALKQKIEMLTADNLHLMDALDRQSHELLQAQTTHMLAAGVKDARRPSQQQASPSAAEAFAEKQKQNLAELATSSKKAISTFSKKMEGRLEGLKEKMMDEKSPDKPEKTEKPAEKKEKSEGVSLKSAADWFKKKTATVVTSNASTHSLSGASRVLGAGDNVTVNNATFVVSRSLLVEEAQGYGAYVCADHSGKEVCVERKTVSSPKETFMAIFKILQKQHHPQLLRVFDWHFSETEVTLVSEMGKRQLNVRVPADETIDEEAAVRICAKLADALAFLHSQSPPIAFHNIRPEAVFVSNDLSDVKIGLFLYCSQSTQVAKSDADVKPLQDSIIKSFPRRCLAPEMRNVTVGLPIGGAADVWLLAALLARLIFGELVSSSIADVLVSNPDSDLTELLNNAGQCSPLTSEVLKASLAADPKGRNGMSQVKEALVRTEASFDP